MENDAGHPCFFDEFCVFAWPIDQFSPWWHSESFREEGFWSTFVIRHSCVTAVFPTALLLSQTFGDLFAEFVSTRITRLNLAAANQSWGENS